MPLGVVIPRTTDDLVAAVQIAAELEVPIVPRGGGTSLSGQSIGPGLVIDCSKYLNTILELDPAAANRSRAARRRARPAESRVGRHGLQFGPEVATASRANLGGMIGNNSAGSRSIVYGKTGDHVRRLRVVLSDGSTAEFGPVGPAEWERKAAGRGLEADIYREVRRVVRANADEIRRRFPEARAAGQRIQPRRPARGGVRPTDRRTCAKLPACTRSSSAARARWRSSPRRSLPWCRGRRRAACSCRISIPSPPPRIPSPCAWRPSRPRSS